MTIFERAFLEAVLLGAACGPLGLWILAFRQTYAAESLAHAMLPGLALAAIAGAPLLLGAAGGIVVAALAVAVTTALGAGLLLAAAPDAPPRLSDLLFGDLLGVGDADLVAAAILALAVPAALAAAHRPLAAAALDASAAPALGVRPARVQALLLVLLGVAIVVAVRGLGNLLVVALLVAPGVAAGRLAPRLGAQLALAALVGAGSGAAGLILSDRLAVAAGASVALVACACALLAVALRPLPGGFGRASRLRRSPIESLGGPPS